MPRKTLVAVLVALTGVIAAAPAGAASTTQCPPGVTDASYCATHNESGLKTAEKAIALHNGAVKITFHCVVSPQCHGIIYLEGPGATSSRAHTSSVVVYGSAEYTVKFGETATISVPLNEAGLKALGRTGTLSTTAVAVSNGVRSVVAHLTVKGHKAAKKKKSKKKAKHVTKAKVSPGFTG
jgi:hypothetical protein